MEQHKEVRIMKERNIKIKDFVHEKKRMEQETGVKMNVTQQDIDDLAHKIKELELQKKDVETQWKGRLQLQEDRVKRIQHESNQMQLKQKEKENEYRMLSLKIKELKRTIQGTYVHKATKDNRKPRKKSARSMNKPTPPKNRKEKSKEMRPNSSRRGGLAEAIRQEYEVDNRELETPMEKNTVSKGVDFNGGIDDEDEMDYENDFDRTMEQSPKPSKL